MQSWPSTKTAYLKNNFSIYHLIWMYIWQYFMCIYAAFFLKALPRMVCRPAHAPRTMDEIPQYYLSLWSLNLTFSRDKMDPTLQSSILSLICMVTVYLCLVWTWGGIWNNFCESLSLLFWQQCLTTYHCRWDKNIIFKRFWLP